MKAFLITLSILVLSCNFLNASVNADKLKELQKQKAEIEKRINPVVLMLLRTLYIHNGKKIYYLNEYSQIPKENVLVKFIDPLYVVSDKPEIKGMVVTRAIIKNQDKDVRQQNLYLDFDVKGKAHIPGSKFYIDKILIVTGIKPDYYKNIPNVDHSLYPIDDYLKYIELSKQISSLKKSDYSNYIDSVPREKDNTSSNPSKNQGSALVQH